MGMFDGAFQLAGQVTQVGGQLYDSWRQRRQSEENVDKTLAAQKSEAELAYQRSVEMWNRQNLYNSPEAQMQRFKEAGLNPHLIYGQGSSGLASSPPQYQPANLQYQYEAPQYGRAFEGVVPLLMQVGTWMQDMKLSQARLESTETGTEKVRQLMDYLAEANPKMLEGLQNKLTLFPYQRSMTDYQSNIARSKLFELEQGFRNEYGDDLFKQMGSAWAPQSGKFADIGGLKRLKYLEQSSRTKLAEAKASWSEFDITDPQALMMMVLQGVMGMAGQTLRLSTRGMRQKPKGRTINEVEERMRGGRTRIRRRINE